MKKQTIAIRAPFEATSGYQQLVYGLFDAEHLFNYDVIFYATKAIPDLSRYGIDTEIINRVKDDFQKDRPSIELFIHPIQINKEENNIFHQIPSHKNRLFFTMWETDNITDYWANVMNTKCSCIITPNQWNIDTFMKCGVKSPIEKCPLFANNIYHYKKPEKREKLILGLSASVLDDRKNIQDFVEVFNSNFQNQPNIELQLKLPQKMKTQIPRYVNSNFKVITDNYTYKQMTDWYHNIDILVSPTKSEGWGLMQHEAMMCGRPVMAAHYGGLKELLNDKNSIPIKYTEEYPENLYFGYSNGKWCKPDLNDFVDKINWCFKNKNVLEKMGKEAHNSVKKLTLKNTINNLNDIIKKFEKK